MMAIWTPQAGRDVYRLSDGKTERGRWVMTSRGIGIVRDCDDFGYLDIMITDAAGYDWRQTTEHCSTIRQARLNEIPAARRPTDDIGLAMGYTKE